jgi:YYY domain-containing protein
VCRSAGSTSIAALRLAAVQRLEATNLGDTHVSGAAAHPWWRLIRESARTRGKQLVTRAVGWRDAGWWAVAAIALLSLAPRLYGLNWDANNHLHPDERQIVFVAMCLGLPGVPGVGNCPPAYTGPGWFFSPASPLNPHFFAYGSFPLYLLALVAHGLAWIPAHTGGRFGPPDGGTWDDFNHFTLVGRTLSAFFDAGSVFLAGLSARRLAGPWAGVLAAALVAVTPLEVQLSHFYAVDSLLLFFVLLTLLGCIRLVQMPEVDSSWRIWRAGLLIGVGCGLAVATKVSAVPLLVPIGVAVILFARRHGLDAAVIATLGILGAGLVIFLVTSPYALLDLSEFRQQVSIQSQLSLGKLDYPYVRQFSETVPYLYQLREMLFFDLGLPLALFALAGIAWAVARVWRALETEWAILVAWIAVYFAIVGRSYTKYPRYMLPIYPPLIICGAGLLVALVAWGVGRTSLPAVPPQGKREPRRHLPSSARGMNPLPSWGRRLGESWYRTAGAVLALLVLVSTLGFMLALVHIYSAPNTRVQASTWIYDHVRPSATLTYEVWDDPLPMLVPPMHPGGIGDGLTAAGHVIDPGEYQQLGLNLYDSDTTTKAQQLATTLASADYVIISSRRLLDSIPLMSDRYPMTTRYYQLLFAGQLGYQLAAHFTAHPNLFSITYDDYGADESFSTFDHPPVWIFQRTGPGPSAQQIQDLLIGDFTLPPAYERLGSERPLLLSSTQTQANSQAEPLGVQFPANSLPNTIPVLWWLLFVELLGLFAFPLAYLAFPGLSDRGFGLSKVVGLLALGWMVWLPASLGALPFDHWIVVGLFLALGAAGGAVAWWRRMELRRFLRERWRVIAVCEAAFLVAFLFLPHIRSLDPDLFHLYHGGEKPFELAILDGILRSRTMPPLDAWFSGGYINYYYYGQYLIAVLIKLTGVTPTTAFNLAIPLLFAVTFTAAFSIVAGLTRRWWAGLLGGLALVVVSNLDGLVQVIGQWRAVHAGQVPLAFDYWQASRVIPCVQLSGTVLPNCADTTINEFPYWSFLFADLHAHVIDLPVVALVIAACASLIAGAREDGGRWRRALPTLAMLALAIGGVWCINTWDLPLCVGLTGLAVTLRPLLGDPPAGWRALRASLTWPRVRAWLAALALPVAGAYVLYLPFHIEFQNGVSGLGPVTTPTDPGQFMILFGLWIFITASFFFVELRDHWPQVLAAPRVTVIRYFLLVVAFVLAYRLSLKALLILLLALGLGLVWASRRNPAKLLTYILLLAGLGIALSMELVYVRDFLDNSPYERMNTVFKFYFEVWLCLSVGSALALSFLLPRVFTGIDALIAGSPRLSLQVPASAEAVEAHVVAARQVRASFARLVFHTPYASAGEGPPGPADAALTGGSSIRPALTSSGVAARSPWQGMLLARGALKGAWVVALLLLLAGSSIFLVDGSAARVEEHLSWAAYQPPPSGIQPTIPSLDGIAYMRGWYPGDYAAITWMNQHIAGTPTIVEASNGSYAWYGRVSIYTGLPAVLGWSDHEAEQRYPAEVYARQADVDAFYSTDDPAAALLFLNRYGVKYVYVGKLERTCYMSAGANNQCVPLTGGALTKFDTLEQEGALRAVYRNPDTVIYQVMD